MRLLHLTLTAILCLFTSLSYAIDVTGANVTYKEPVLNADDTTLDDLSHTNVYVDGVKGGDIPATSPNGGGNISVPVNVDVAVGKVKTFTVNATATDTSGNESLPSTTITIRVDKLSPKHPD